MFEFLHVERRLEGYCHFCPSLHGDQTRGDLIQWKVNDADNLMNLNLTETAFSFYSMFLILEMLEKLYLHLDLMRFTSCCCSSSLSTVASLIPRLLQSSNAANQFICHHININLLKYTQPKYFVYRICRLLCRVYCSEKQKACLFLDLYVL